MAQVGDDSLDLLMNRVDTYAKALGSDDEGTSKTAKASGKGRAKKDKTVTEKGKDKPYTKPADKAKAADKPKVAKAAAKPAAAPKTGAKVHAEDMSREEAKRKIIHGSNIKTWTQQAGVLYKNKQVSEEIRERPLFLGEKIIQPALAQLGKRSIIKMPDIKQGLLAVGFDEYEINMMMASIEAANPRKKSSKKDDEADE